MVKLIDGYWVDKNGNKWNAKYYDKEGAKWLSRTLVNCIDCINCENCKNCKNCKNCINCTKCINCVECIDCDDCLNCINCDHYVMYKMDFEKFHKEFDKYDKGSVNYSIEKIDDHNFKITIENEVEFQCSVHQNECIEFACIRNFSKLNEYLKKELNTDLLWSFYEKYLNYLEYINEPLIVQELQNFINSLVWDIKRIKKYVSEKKEEDIKRIIKTNKREFTLSGHLGLDLIKPESMEYVNDSDDISLFNIVNNIL